MLILIERYHLLLSSLSCFL